MPFRAHTDLDSQTLSIMTAAYDDACRILDIKPSDPRSSALAVAIATAARAGERDRQKLVSAASALAAIQNRRDVKSRETIAPSVLCG